MLNKSLVTKVDRELLELVTCGENLSKVGEEVHVAAPRFFQDVALQYWMALGGDVDLGDVAEDVLRYDSVDAIDVEYAMVEVDGLRRQQTDGFGVDRAANQKHGWGFLEVPWRVYLVWDLRILETCVVLVEELLDTAEVDAHVVDDVAQLGRKAEEWELLTNLELLDASNDGTIPVEQYGRDRPDWLGEDSLELTLA